MSGRSGGGDVRARPGTGDRASLGSRRRESPAASDRGAGERLVLDPIACVGHGLCAELFPEGIVLDDWGYPMLTERADDPALRAHARRAAAACPALALRLARGR